MISIDFYCWWLEDASFQSLLVGPCLDAHTELQNGLIFKPEPGPSPYAARARHLFLKPEYNLSWVASALSNPLNLTHAAVGRGPIWLCAFGP